MGILFYTYFFLTGMNCSLYLELVSKIIVIDTPDSPYRFILYGAAVLAFAYWLVMSQTRLLFKTRKLLKEKEQALELIAKQKIELELRDKNLTDSLIYAQRIQEAMLPSEKFFRNHFPDSFIFFKPKDIVSGDFYWIGEKDEKVFIIAADCTGHGVPGALMSMIGLEIIDKTINDDNIIAPSEILSILNKGLEKTFSREKNIGTIIRDGMDIGLCVIDKKVRKLTYAGAFFPLYMIRDKSIIEIKGDKLIIGMNPMGLKYADHEIELMDDDILYMFSDGYVDQFGGSENKKFMYRRFRHLLLMIHSFPVDDQKSILEENIRSWIGNDEQLDDITVIGFKPFLSSSR